MLNLRAAEPTPAEIFAVAALIEKKPSMYSAYCYLMEQANRKTMKQERAA